MCYSLAEQKCLEKSFKVSKFNVHEVFHLFGCSIRTWSFTLSQGPSGKTDADAVDAVDSPLTVEDEIHNCQAVIDSLAMDVLNTSLSHITGQDIVAGDRTAIGDLLEVFSGLMEFMLEEISSTSSSNGIQPGAGSS